MAEMTDGQAAASGDSPFQRYVPLVTWTICIITFLMIGLKITGYGYLPGGDLRRHVGQAFTHRPYTDIVVMRSSYVMDHSPGWDRLLRALHEVGGLNKDELVSFSIVALLLCVFVAPLPWLRRPEAWLAAVLAQLVAIPEWITRLTQARPFLLTEGLCAAVLISWSRPERRGPSWLKIALTGGAIALSTYVHGTWYLWALPVMAFFLAGWWRESFWLGVAWVAGAFVGGLLTGRPIAFLHQAVAMLGTISAEHVPQWMLVGELLPSDGEFATLALVAIVFLWRRQTGSAKSILYCGPLLAMMALCWILGFRADRCWADWGIPAVLVWLALQFQELMSAAWPAGSWKCLLTCALLAAPFYFDSTNDLNRRFSRSADEVFLDASDPNLKGWLPDDHGIFYTGNLAFFYSTFYENPQANWRYILGYEPALMPDDDRKIYRTIQANNGAIQAYQPWVDKMQPADRMAIYSGSQPDLPGLEWHYAGGALWIGRKAEPKGN